MNKNNKQKVKFESLESALLSVDRPTLNQDRAHAIKARVLSKIDAPVASYLRLSGRKVVPERFLRIRMRQNVFASLSSQEVESRVQGWSFAFRRSLAVFTLVIFSAMFLLPTFFSKQSVVFAGEFTSIETFSGSVSVLRDGEPLPVYIGMRLFENDHIVTGDYGYASIGFFDNSVSRLAGDTELVLDSLVKSGTMGMKSYVEVSLDHGVVWSRVVKLVERKSVFVVKSLDVAFSTRDGAFNVRSEDDNVEVEVYDNAIDLKTNGVEDRVYEGKKAIVSADNNRVSVVNVDSSDNSWVDENLKSDEDHVEDVSNEIAEVKKNTSVTLKDKAVYLFTFDDLNKKKMHLNMLGKELIQLQSQVDYEFKNSLEVYDKFKVTAEEFGAQIEELSAMIEKVQSVDEEYADSLKDYLNGQILLQKKVLGFVSAGSPSYSLKEKINDLELSVADTDEEKLEVKVSHAVDKLGDVEEVAESGDQELLKEVVEDYNSDIDDVNALMDDVDTVSREVDDVLLSSVDDVEDEVQKVVGDEVSLNAVNVSQNEGVIEDVLVEEEDDMEDGDVSVEGSEFVKVDNNKVEKVITGADKTNVGEVNVTVSAVEEEPSVDSTDDSTEKEVEPPLPPLLEF